jgi:hypothetical protein
MSFIDPIVPDPNWGNASPNVDPEEYEDED